MMKIRMGRPLGYNLDGTSWNVFLINMVDKGKRVKRSLKRERDHVNGLEVRDSKIFISLHSFTSHFFRRIVLEENCGFTNTTVVHDITDKILKEQRRRLHFALRR